MWRFNRYKRIAIGMAFFCAVSGGCYAQSAASPLLLAGESILDEVSADVTGDSVADRVLLIGTRNEIGNFARDLNVIVVNGATKESARTWVAEASGYDGKLFVGDFTGEKICDVMFSAASGGSGGMVSAYIARFDGKRPEIIFGAAENRGFLLGGAFVEGFRATLQGALFEAPMTLDLRPKKEIYIAAGIYDASGALLQQTAPLVYPFAKIEPVDEAGSGTYGIRGSQRIAGAYNADTLAVVSSRFAYENGVWRCRDAQLVLPIRTEQSAALYLNKAPDRVVLGAGDNGKTATVAAGGIVELRLPENPTTGYVWQFRNFDAGSFSLLSERRLVPDATPQMVGQPGLYVVELKVLRVGAARLELTCARAWESQDQAAERFSLTVRSEAIERRNQG